MDTKLKPIRCTLRIWENYISAVAECEMLMNRKIQNSLESSLKV